MSEASDPGLLTTTFQMSLWKNHCGVNNSPAATSSSTAHRLPSLGLGGGARKPHWAISG